MEDRNPCNYCGSINYKRLIEIDKVGVCNLYCNDVELVFVFDVEIILNIKKLRKKGKDSSKLEEKLFMKRPTSF